MALPLGVFGYMGYNAACTAAFDEGAVWTDPHAKRVMDPTNAAPPLVLPSENGTDLVYPELPELADLPLNWVNDVMFNPPQPAENSTEWDGRIQTPNLAEFSPAGIVTSIGTPPLSLHMPQTEAIAENADEGEPITPMVNADALMAGLLRGLTSTDQQATSYGSETFPVVDVHDASRQPSSAPQGQTQDVVSELPPISVPRPRRPTEMSVFSYGLLSDAESDEDT